MLRILCMLCLGLLAALAQAQTLRWAGRGDIGTIENTASAAVSGLPSENLTPVRIVKRQVVSFTTVQLSASAGSMRCCRFNRASCS